MGLINVLSFFFSPRAKAPTGRGDSSIVHVSRLLWQVRKGEEVDGKGWRPEICPPAPGWPLAVWLVDAGAGVATGNIKGEKL
jgi:hypothetical protein